MNQVASNDVDMKRHSHHILNWHQNAESWVTCGVLEDRLPLDVRLQIINEDHLSDSGLGFRVWSLEFGVWGLGFRV